MRESRWDRGELGVSTIGIPAGVPGPRAQVLVASAAVLARPAGVSEPGDTYPIAHLEPVTGSRSQLDDLAYHLMSGNYSLAVYGKITLGDMQVGAANPAGQYGNQ
jgi:hypothetical protein